MSQTPPNAGNPGNGPTLPPAKPPRKRAKLWLWVAGGVLVLLILLVLLAPSLAGLGFVRSIVVGKVNENLNGSVEIGDYTLGWSGISASDVKVYDAQKTLILQLNKFSTNLSLLGALRGNLALGDTDVDIDLVRAEIGDDGQLNYLKLLKKEAKPKSPDEGAATPKETQNKTAASPLPNISGKLTVNYKGTIYQGNNPIVQIEPGTAVVGIPDINQPITTDVTFKYSVNNGPIGSIHLAGDASAVKNNQLDLEHLTANEALDLKDVDLGALAPVLQMASPALKLKTEGIASGSLAIKAVGSDGLTAQGQLNVAKFAASGEPLKGNDRLAIDQITIPIDISRTMKDGQSFIDVKHADVLLGGAAGAQLGKITVVASGPQDALLSAAALVPAVAQRALLGTEPDPQSLIVNGEGSATIAADFDIAAIASQLPNTISLQKGMALSQGHLTHLTTIAISKDTAKISSDTKLPDLKGTANGRTVQLSPIDVSAALSAVGGTTPDLHDLAIKLSSGFLNASGGGPTLSQEKLTGNFDLANLQTQASQFVDLDALLNPPKSASTAPAVAVAPPHVQLAGAGTFDLSTDGNLTKPDGQGKVATSLVITGINASGIGALPPIKLDNLNATLSGDLHRGAAAIDYKNFAAALSAAGISVANKDASAPAILDNETITANLTGDVSLPVGDGPKSATISALEVKSSSDLFGLSAAPKAPLTVSIDGKIFKASGTILANADLKKLSDLAQRFSPATAGTAAASPSAGQLQSGQLNGTLTLSRGKDPQTDVAFDGAVTNLTVSTQQKPINNETIKLTLHASNPDDGSPLKADASIDSRFMTAKLANASLNIAGTSTDVWDKLLQAEIDLNVPDLPTVYGILNAFSAPAAQQASAVLPVLEPAEPATLEPVRARIFLTALDATDTETPEEAARRRKREKAAKTEKAAKATKAKEAKAAVEATAPLQVTSGSMAGKINIVRDGPSQTTTLTVSDFSISKLAIARGDSSYAFARDIDFKLTAAVKAAADPAKPAVVDQIQQIQITQLTGDLGVAQLTMPQPITIANPGAADQIDAHGTIKIDGTLGDATPLLAVLNGSPKPMPYGGDYDVSQVLRSGPATQGKLLNVTGSVNVNNFEVLDDSGKAVYTEPTVAIKNDLDYIIANAPPTTGPSSTAKSGRSADQAIVRSLTVDLPSSKALAVNFSGRVADPLNKRVIKGIGQDAAAKLDLTYDLAKLWIIIKPTLAADMQEKYKNLKVTGQEHRTFTISGYFPMAKTTAESIKHLNADGGFALDELDLPQGLTITKFDLPFKMVGGVLQTAAGAPAADAGQAAGAQPVAAQPATAQPAGASTAICNQGVVDLSDITLDLGQPAALLTVGNNHKLLQGVHVNPVLAGALGSGNVLFKDATQANGLLDVTVVRCDKVPVGDLVARRDDAAATITYSVSDLAIDGPVPKVLSDVLPLGGQGLHGGIQDGKLTLANGEVQNDFALNIIRYAKATNAGQTDASGETSATPTDDAGNQLTPVNLPLKFSGGVVLASGLLKNFLVNVPQGLLPAKWASIFPNGLSVPFSGDSGHPKLDIEKAVTENAGSGLLGGNGKGGPGNLLNGLFKKKKKKAADPDSDSDSGGQ